MVSNISETLQQTFSTQKFCENTAIGEVQYFLFPWHSLVRYQTENKTKQNFDLDGHFIKIKAEKDSVEIRLNKALFFLKNKSKTKKPALCPVSMEHVSEK